MSHKELQLNLVEGEDFYWEDGLMVLTAKYLLKRGDCCKSDCRHCPWKSAPTTKDDVE